MFALFDLFKYKSWVLSLLLHAGAGVAFIYVTVGGGGAADEDSVIVEGPPVMSIPVNYSKPAEKKSEPVEKLIPEELTRGPEPVPETPAAGKEPEQESRKEHKQEVSTVLSPPCYKGNIPPRYPRVARRLNYEGTVILLVTIAADGKVADIRIKHSSGYGVLDTAAEKAVWKWKFTAARAGDMPVEAQVEVPIRFELNE